MWFDVGHVFRKMGNKTNTFGIHIFYNNETNFIHIENKTKYFKIMLLTKLQTHLFTGS